MHVGGNSYVFCQKLLIFCHKKVILILIVVLIPVLIVLYTTWECEVTYGILRNGFDLQNGKRGVSMTAGDKSKREKIKENNSALHILVSKQTAVPAIICTVMILFLSGLYLRYAWNGYQEEASAQAIALANSVEAVMPQRHISRLSGSVEDLDKPEYEMMKENLTLLVEVTNPIRFAYLLAERSENIVILMDSESPESSDYSPPGQVYGEANDVFREPFQTNETILTKPITDRWGTRISVLVPVNDPTTGNVIAVFGVDYSASEWYAQIWKHMVPDIIIAISMLSLSFILLYAWIQHDANKMLSKQLAFDEALYHSAFDQAPIGVAIVNDKNFVYQSDFGHININPMFEQILGRTSYELTKINWPEITHPDDLQADLEKFEQFKKGEISGYSMEKRFIKPDGSCVWVNMTVSPLSGIPNKDSMHLCLIDDISVRKETEDLLRESERRQAVLLSHLPGLAYRCNYDPAWTMQFVSDGCLELTGYPSDSLINNKELSYNELISPEYRDALWNEWKRILALKKPFKYEYEITTATGERKWVIEMGQGIYNHAGEVEALEGIVLDISDRKEVENHLRYINDHDRWSGLYNRDYLEALLAKDAKQKKTSKRALIGINLSTVQLLTASYGFHYTQNLLKKAADTLSRYSTEKRMLFNTYENRFVFYVVNYKDKNELTNFSEVIAKTLKDLFITERVGGGIGIIEIDRDNERNVDLLLRKLLIASERSINLFDKGFRACFYDIELEALVNREGFIRQELSEIAEDNECNELFLLYQPILNLKTNSICGFEALSRLKTEELGLVLPVEFIPIAEETQLIIPIGEKVLINAFRFLNKLKEQGYDSVSIAVNVSAIQLLRPNFTDRLFELIGEMHVNPKDIGIEITESVFASDYEVINNILSKLKSAGLHIAIDDFGTGYSSLAREKELNVNCLKIDKSFIDKLLEVDPDKAITDAIISMAHRLGHCVIAEGVEQEEQKQYLLAHGCDKIQGYLVGRPLEEDAAMELLSKQLSFNNDCYGKPC